jgi:hypothetical protein
MRHDVCVSSLDAWCQRAKNVTGTSA